MRLGNPRVAIDSRVEEDGKWVDCPTIWWQDEAHPMRVLLRGAYSRKHQALFRALRKRLDGKEGDEREETAIEISIDLAVALVAGWENWIDENGEPIRYSVEACRTILSNPDNRRVLSFITEVTSDQSTFDVEAREKTEKN